MTKKDYELIARVLREVANEYEAGTVGRIIIATIADDFAHALRSTNPRFEKERFLSACAPKD